MHCTKRELRLMIYSFLVGAIIASIVLQTLRTNHARSRINTQPVKCPSLPKPPKVDLCPPCEACECPKCSLGGTGPIIQVPKTLKSFLARHWDVMHNGAAVIAKTRMKSVPSFIVSLHPSEKDPTISHNLIERGGWDEHLIVRMCREMNMAPENAYFVDVGAYVGTLSLGVSACDHKVIAFEPMTTNAYLLKESAFLNQLSSEKFTIYNMALGNINGKACFLASSGNQGDGRFVSGGEDDHECYPHETPIEMARLQDVLQDDVCIWTLHIDAQGFELAILAGAEEILTGAHPPRYLHIKLGRTLYSLEMMEVTRGMVETLAWLKEVGYALRDEDNEPIRDVSQFVWGLGHEETYVVGIHGVK